MQEDSQTEFKSSFSDAAIESLVAFTNTKGGRVLIGVDNHGNPAKSFTIGGESLQNWVNEVKNKTQPSIIPDVEVITIQGKWPKAISPHLPTSAQLMMLSPILPRKKHCHRIRYQKQWKIRQKILRSLKESTHLYTQILTTFNFVH